MTYNLTEKQKELAREIVRCVKHRWLEECFSIAWDGHNYYSGFSPDIPREHFGFLERGPLSALVASGLLLEFSATDSVMIPHFSRTLPTTYYLSVYTVTQSLFAGVESNFAEEPEAAPLSTLAHAAPPELNLSLDRLRKKYPDPARLGFLIMRFGKAEPYGEIVKAIQETAARHGIAVVRADDHEFHADLWGNVRTFLHGCSFGVAIYERIEQDEPNANIGLEVGYLLAMGKPVLLLKERTLRTLQTDLMGRLYRVFDEHNAAGTIPGQLERWLIDNRVIVPPHA